MRFSRLAVSVVVLAGLSCGQQSTTGITPPQPTAQTSVSELPDFKSIALKAIDLAKALQGKKIDSFVSSTPDPVAKALIRYIHYRYDPGKATKAFINAIPNQAKADFQWWGIDSLTPMDGNPSGIRLPKEDKDLSAWSMPTALLQLAIKGNSDALSRWLRLRGDGEYGEGLSEEFGELIQSHPRLVVRNWSLIKESQGPNIEWPFLEDESLPADAERFSKLRKAYSDLLPPTDPRLKEILRMLSSTPPTGASSKTP